MDPQSTTVEQAVEALLAPADPVEDGLPEEQEAEQPNEAEDQTAENEAEEEEGASEADEADDETAESDDTEPDDDSEEDPEVYTVKVNGVEKEATLDELVSSYSRLEDYKEKTTALADERKSFEAEKEAAVTEFRNKFEQLNTHLDGMTDEIAQIEQMVIAADAEGDIDEANRLERLLRGKTKQRNEAAQTAQQHAAHEMAQTLQREKAKLLERIPAWQDPEVYKKEGGEMAAYLKETYGVQDQELKALTDHRLIDLARKAKLYDEGQKAKPKAREIARKKVAKVPKVTKPGVSKTRRAGKADLYAEDIKRARKTGRIDDAAAAVERLLSG